MFFNKGEVIEAASPASARDIEFFELFLRDPALVHDQRDASRGSTLDLS
jgi:hypothetical protein